MLMVLQPRLADTLRAKLRLSSIVPDGPLALVAISMIVWRQALPVACVPGMATKLASRSCTADNDPGLCSSASSPT